jgi:alkyl hydroperoxide reductase subunit AhpC
MPLYERELDRVRARDAQVVGVSTDSRFALAAWAQQLGGISYPLLSDFFPHGAVAERYGVLRPEGMAERSLFVIDKQGVVRYVDVHELREVPDETALFEELAKLDE